MSDFNALKFVADNAGLNIFKALEKAYEQGNADAAKEALIDKDTNVPSKSALDHINNVVKDDAYKRGYEQGKAEKVPAITMEWIGEYLAWLKDIGGYGLSDARAVQSMLVKWKMEHTDGCGPDSCKIGG